MLCAARPQIKGCRSAAQVSTTATKIARRAGKHLAIGRRAVHKGAIVASTPMVMEAGRARASTCASALTGWLPVMRNNCANILEKDCPQRFVHLQR